MDVREDNRINLLSATGSTRMGKDVAQKVGARLGKSLLELGGNNAIIVTPSVDIKQAVINIVFGAVGTCGQGVQQLEESLCMNQYFRNKK